MSVTYQATVYDEELMSDEFLKSRGVHGGVFGQLSVNMDVEDELEIMNQAESRTFGDSSYELPRELNSLFSGLTPVTDELINTVDELIESHDTSEMRKDPNHFRDWLAENKGEKVFTDGL